MIEVDIGPTPDVLREEYLDVYEGIHSEIVNSTRFDEKSDLSTTYLGRSDISKNLFPYQNMAMQQENC